jgi:hypothetical protein
MNLNDEREEYLSYSKILKSSYVGLFWFNDDFTEVRDVVAVAEFDYGDMMAKKTIHPTGNHKDYNPLPAMTPRGRVALIGGEIVVYVGLQCPDSALKLVKNKFDLNRYEGHIEIIKDYHWDKTVNGSLQGRDISKDDLKLVKQSCVGLFWFDDSYSKISRVEGLKEFSNGDVVAKAYVNPIGRHIDYDSLPAKHPRGRVVMDAGNIFIYVGLDCPDSAISLVKDYFGLTKYGSKVNVLKNEHWNVTFSGRVVGKDISIVKSFYVGLFWIWDDYSGLTDFNGLEEFSEADVVAKQTILPKGAHRDYKSDFKYMPRGRVELNKGVVTIYVGLECPDSVISIIKKEMGLRNYGNSVIVVRNSFWDKKSSGSNLIF